MKQYCLFVMGIAISLSAFGQELSIIIASNPDSSKSHLFYTSSGSMLTPRARVYYLQSTSSRDTIISSNYFLNVRIYHDKPSICYGLNSMHSGDYAFGGCVSDQGDTIMVCVNKDLSLRFTFPAGTTNAAPFENGISIVSSGPSWDFHGIYSQYGAVARDGMVLFDSVYPVVYIAKDKAVAIKKKSVRPKNKWNEYQIVIKNNKGDILESIVYYYPAVYDDYILADSEFRSDLRIFDDSNYNNDLSIYGNQTRDIYSAFINLVQLDFISAYNNLRQAENNQNQLIRKCAKKNKKNLERIFRCRWP